MKKSEKDKLKHDFANSIVIINNLANSASSFVQKIYQNTNNLEHLKKNQIELFAKTMVIIQEQTSKIEKYFESLYTK